MSQGGHKLIEVPGPFCCFGSDLMSSTTSRGSSSDEGSSSEEGSSYSERSSSSDESSDSEESSVDGTHNFGIARRGLNLWPIQ